MSMKTITNSMQRSALTVHRGIGEMIQTAPTTNIRILVTLGLAIGTAIRYWVTIGNTLWEPSIEWLAFLATMSGIDAIQYTQKRMTNWHPSGLPDEAEVDISNKGSIPNDEELG